MWVVLSGQRAGPHPHFQSSTKRALSPPPPVCFDNEKRSWRSWSQEEACKRANARKEWFRLSLSGLWNLSGHAGSDSLLICSFFFGKTKNTPRLGVFARNSAADRHKPFEALMDTEFFYQRAYARVKRAGAVQRRTLFKIFQKAIFPKKRDALLRTKEHRNTRAVRPQQQRSLMEIRTRWGSSGCGGTILLNSHTRIHQHITQSI